MPSDGYINFCSAFPFVGQIKNSQFVQQNRKHLTVSCRVVPCHSVSCHVVPFVVPCTSLTERGWMARVCPPQKIFDQSCSFDATTPDTFVRLFCPTRQNFLPAPCLSAPPYHLFRGTNDERGRTRVNKVSRRWRKKIRPKTVPSPCQSQASASVYVYPSILPKDSRAPPLNRRRRRRHHHHLVSLVVGIPRYVQ